MNSVVNYDNCGSVEHRRDFFVMLEVAIIVV